ISEIDLGSYKTYQEMKALSEKTWEESVPHPNYDYVFAENCTGSYVFYSKNCKECYDSGYCEDCKFMLLIKSPSVKDSYDYTDWGEGAERIYDSITVGNNVSDVKFSQDIHSSHHIEYSKSCMASSNLLGCVAIRNKNYFIFNKQYSKEEYTELRGKIIEQMKGAGEYGEFFPIKTSPHDYNDSFAHMFYPLNKEETEKYGSSWMEHSSKEYDITIPSKDLPDHIRDASEEILKEVIGCSTCSRGYRITNQELSFLRKHNFPLPRECPFCRIENKIKHWVQQMTLNDRTCDKCGKNFRTHYTKDQSPRIYCKDCYMQEVY
ncbi:hypothetical protein K2P96_01460, partial [Patescibacteria group bacterium]|nr:hypothetical protein [Patescibacteria group bacterium]